MKKVVAAVVVLGKAVLCFPLLTKRWKTSHLSTYLINLLIYGFTFVTIIFVPFFWTSKLWLDIEQMPSRDNKRVSKLVQRCLDHIPSAASDVFIRFGSILLWREKDEVFDYLISRPTAHSDDTNTNRVKIPIILKVFIAPIVLAAARVGTPLIELWQPLPDGYKLKWLPGTGLTVRLWILVADFQLALGHYYAWVFITGIGLSLLQRFRKIATMSQTAPETVVDSLNHDGSELSKIRRAFEKYGRVAGTYCFGLLGFCTCHIITSLSDVVYSNGDTSTAAVFERWLNLVWVATLLGLMSFGNYVSNSVSFDDCLCV